MPYDQYCPSVQKDLHERCCNECGVYHASKVAARKYKQNVHRQDLNLPIPKRRPVRIAARRQRELMCLLKDSLLENSEDVEWLNVDEIQLPDSYIPNDMNEKCDVDEATVISNVQEWISNPWTSL